MKQHKDFTKLVADGIFFTDSYYDEMCAFCEVSPHGPHAEDCPTTQARELLKEEDEYKKQKEEFDKEREYVRCEYCNKLMERRMLRHHQMYSKRCMKLQAILLRDV